MFWVHTCINATEWNKNIPLTFFDLQALHVTGNNLYGPAQTKLSIAVAKTTEGAVGSGKLVHLIKFASFQLLCPKLTPTVLFSHR